MLNNIKTALRITTTAFDSELQTLIDACITEMQALGVKAAYDDTEDPQIITAVIAYCKWQFGNNEDAERWEGIYHTKLGQLKIMKGYRES